MYTLISYDLDGVLNAILLLMFGPSLLFLVIGIILKIYKKNKASKTFFILAIVCQITSLGICGALIVGV